MTGLSVEFNFRTVNLQGRIEAYNMASPICHYVFNLGYSLTGEMNLIAYTLCDCVQKKVSPKRFCNITSKLHRIKYNFT